MASNHHHLWLHRPLIRSSSLPTLLPYESEEEEEDDETDDEEDDCTEETDGSTPVDENFRSPLPSFGSAASAASPTTFNQLSTDPYPRPLEERETSRSPRVARNNGTGGAYPYTEDYNNVYTNTRPVKPLILQLTESGNFSIMEDQAPPPKGDCRYSSCLDFNEFHKKIQTKQEVRRKPWSNKKINFHQVKTPKKLLDLMERNPQADLLQQDINGDTPLHVYISEIRKHRVELLITILSSIREIDVNVKNTDGHTPLHIAAMKNDIQCAIVLIVFGADPKIQDTFYETPYDRAPDYKYGKVKALLEKYTIHPGFIHKSPSPIYGSGLPSCSRDMIGYRLSCGLEMHFALEIENEVLNTMRQREIEDASEASACFMQLNHVLRWKTTKGNSVRPGSRVLFLDGGGVRGLVLIEILIEIEKRTKQKIVDLFDWIVGTSTGAIVALGLVHAGLSLPQIRGLFFQLSNRVFKEGLTGTWFQSISNSREMNYILQKVFKEKKMNEVAEPKVIVTAVSVRDSSYPLEFFTNYENESAHSTTLVWEVARMVSAAPMYFTDYNGYVDGGIQANNPCDQGMNKIVEYYERNRMTLPHFPLMISIGTGTFPSQELKDNKLYISGLDGFWMVKNLFDLLLASISKSQEAAMSFKKRCQSMSPEVPFFRFNPSFDKYIKPNETDRKLLVDMILTTKSYMMDDNSFADLFSIVKIFDELNQFPKIVSSSE